MIDREKVMEALDCLAHGGGTYDCLRFPCPYGFYGYTDCHKWEIARDALALLKEHETANIYKCKRCGTWVSAENVVRCKDCVYGKHEKNESTGMEWIYCQHHRENRPTEWFCASGSALKVGERE